MRWGGDATKTWRVRDIVPAFGSKRTTSAPPVESTQSHPMPLASWPNPSNPMIALPGSAPATAMIRHM